MLQKLLPEEQWTLLSVIIMVEHFNSTCLWFGRHWAGRVRTSVCPASLTDLLWPLLQVVSLIGAVLIYTQHPCTPRRLLSIVLLSLAIVYYCATCNYWIHKCWTVVLIVSHRGWEFQFNGQIVILNCSWHLYVQPSYPRRSSPRTIWMNFSELCLLSSL